MYRRTSKYAKRREWHPRPVVAIEDQRPPVWQPPKLRRRVTIEDFDGGEPCTHVVELYRTSRIDSYRAVIDGREWKSRIGWSRVLDGLRRAMPRLAGQRNNGRFCIVGANGKREWLDKCLLGDGHKFERDLDQALNEGDGAYRP